MDLILNTRWLDLGVRNDVSDLGTLHIADTNVLDEAFLHKLL